MTNTMITCTFLTSFYTSAEHIHSLGLVASELLCTCQSLVDRVSWCVFDLASMAAE